MITATMNSSYSPIVVGDTGAVFAPTLTEDGAALNITGATLAIQFDNELGTSAIGMGTWTITNAAGGQASYAYAAADVATPGTYTAWITVTLAGKPAHAAPILLLIESAP